MSEDIKNIKIEIKKIKQERLKHVQNLLESLDENYHLKGRYRKRKISKTFLKYIEEKEGFFEKKDLKLLKKLNLKPDWGPDYFGGRASFGCFWKIPSYYLLKETYPKIIKLLNLIIKYKDFYIKENFLEKCQQEREKY